MFRTAALVVIAAAAVLAACGSEGSTNTGDDDIVASKKDEHWFYGGPIPQLDDPHVTASLRGHTAHVSGLLPAGTSIPDLPHVRTKSEGGRTRVDIVYPIASARPSKSNAIPAGARDRTFGFEGVRAYRPNGIAVTKEEGEHFVTWGGFPFFAYNGGIAFHGPITSMDNEAPGDMAVWFLQRGNVSGGCNRMMGEHIVEMTHILGVSMRKVYNPNDTIRPTTTADVRVTNDFDTLDGKFIDVDYPTTGDAVRPGTEKGAENVVMFGSWVATETPDGRDLPPDMKFEGGVAGKLYDFQQHAVRGNVCSMPKASLPELKTIAARTGGILPADFCAKKIACDTRNSRVCKPSEIL